MKVKHIVGLLMCFLYLPTLVKIKASFLQQGNFDKEDCDLFTGEWILNNSAPSYANRSCKFLSARWNCVKNGRPDTDYLFWRWKPYNCNFQQLNPRKFLSAMRDKSLAMIGDSLLRNQMQSLLCLLTEVEKPVHTYHGKEYTSTKGYFHSYNFTLVTYWAPFLLKADFLSKGKVNLHLDTLDNIWTREYHRHNYVVIAAGPWFSTPMILMENNTIVGCHSCRGEYKELTSFYPYRRALQMVFNFIIASDHKPLVIFRNWSPEHIEYAKWVRGGFCNKTKPYSEGEYTDTPVGRKYFTIDMEEFNKIAVTGYQKGIHMKLLDIYHLSLLRPDGHPGPYMNFHPFDRDRNARVQNDCLHWCLPGPPDSWNDLMMKMLLNEENVCLNGIS